ncbi:hypothetical protein [Nocardia rhizosphaerihabitans]|uniref:hypothetical protein n=1 Tax=Nocardia rhizosphaerihabitans TaxID=1691570 RepID=UPI0016642D10|nr:hypothetical protein [Nocardia rhizosphaerihabitans]
MCEASPRLRTHRGRCRVDDLNIPVLDAFFDLLIVLARSGVSAVAEAAFQDKLWFYTRSPVVVRRLIVAGTSQ